MLSRRFDVSPRARCRQRIGVPPLDVARAAVYSPNVTRRRAAKGTSRRFLCALFAAATLFCGARSTCAITAQLVASGFSQPLFVTAPPGDTSSIYIVEQGGKIWRFNLQTNALDSTPFFDISDIALVTDEQGLLGLAFDPNFATNGKFYLHFVVAGGAFGNGTSHISMFRAPSGTTVSKHPPEQKRRKHRHRHRHPKPEPTPTPKPGPHGEVLLLKFDHPEANHNGGWIGFSNRPNDGQNLYIATGDGGNAYDQGTGHIEPGGNAQNITTLLGKMLRIHVNPATGAVSIPANNPFVNSTRARHEIFLYGLRNPFRNSFDRQTGNLFIGDVGQDTREEVDVQPASNAGGGEN